jgi:hypothetical protein
MGEDMNCKLLYPILACCLMLVISITTAENDMGSIRVLYTNGAGSARTVSPAANVDVLRDGEDIGTTNDSGYLYFTLDQASMGNHTFSSFVVVGSNYYSGSIVKNVTPETKDFTLMLKRA